MNINPTTWGWDEWKAAGRHVGTYAAGGLTVAVAFNVLSSGDAATINEGIGNITSGLEQVAKGVAAIFGVVYPIYNMLKAKGAAEPANQAKAVADNLRRNGSSTVPDDARKDIIGAVATMPEVKGVVVAGQALATAIPERNVVATPAELRH